MIIKIWSVERRRKVIGILESIKKVDRRYLAKSANVDEGVIKRIEMGNQVRLIDFVKVARAVHFTESDARVYWLQHIKVQRFDIVKDLAASRGFTNKELRMFTKKETSLFKAGKLSYSDNSFFEMVEFLENFPPIREILQKYQRDNHFSDIEIAELLDISPAILRTWYNSTRIYLGLRQKCYDLLDIHLQDPPILARHKKAVITEKEAPEAKENPFLLPAAVRQERLRKHVIVAIELSTNTELLDALDVIEKENLDLGFLIKLTKDFQSYV